MTIHSAYRFGKFELNPSSRAVSKDGIPLRLGGRAFDILALLLSRAGEVVGKEELIAAAWPNLHVEENNLRVHLTALRKVLDDTQPGRSAIANVPSRGYSFVAPVARIGPAAAGEVAEAQHNLPLTVGQVLGRSAVVDTIADKLVKRRAVTIVGHGGVGKTTVALQVAERQLADSVIVAFADLAPLSDPSLAFGTIASSLGCLVRSQNSLEDLIGFIGDRTCCIVLDSCEHVVEAVARHAVSLLARCHNVRLLATSRQPLRIPEEWIYRIGGLEYPDDGHDMPAAEAIRFPAIQLFVERATAATGDFVLTDADAPFVVDICRRLEGIALAIELAAARVGSIGIKGLSELSTDPARLIEQKRRGAIERHSSLQAAIDWSYGILTPTEKIAFRRCCMFNGSFDLQAARAVIADDLVSAQTIGDAVCELVEKSFLFADITEDAIQYRALDSTRFYGKALLRQEAEQDLLERKHATYFRDFFEKAERDWKVEANKVWLSRTAAQIVNLRQALDWCYSSEGDVDIGCALTVAAVPLWLSLSLIDECLQQVQHALGVLQRQPDLQEPDQRMKMRLHAALGWPQMVKAAEGGGTPSWRVALGIAESLGDLDYQLRALWALWVDAKNSGLPRDGLALAERFTAVAIGSEEYVDRLVGKRLRGASLHLLGRHDEAREAIEGMLSEYRAPAVRSHAVRFQFDQETLAHNTLARVLWVQGFVDQALDEVTSNVRRAAELDHRLSLSSVLAESGCPVVFLEGDLDLCEGMVARLASETKAQALDVWSTYGDAFAGDLLVRRGDVGSGVALLRSATDKLRRTNFVFHLTPFLGALAAGLSMLKQPRQALDLIEEGLDRCADTGEAWYLPELLRLKGRIALDTGDEAGVASLEQAIAVAEEQGAGAWTLRATTCLARHWRSVGRQAEAARLLRPLVALPGASGRDLAYAKALLAALEDDA